MARTSRLSDIVQPAKVPWLLSSCLFLNSKAATNIMIQPPTVSSPRAPTAHAGQGRGINPHCCWR